MDPQWGKECVLGVFFHWFGLDLGREGLEGLPPPKEMAENPSVFFLAVFVIYDPIVVGVISPYTYFTLHYGVIINSKK